MRGVVRDRGPVRLWAGSFTPELACHTLNAPATPAVSPSALEGLRVLDLCEGPAGAYCGQLLATYGAEVTLIEPPDGHPFRRLGPFLPGQSGPETSLPFLWYQQGKRSAILDLHSAPGRQEWLQRAAAADVILESSPPGHQLPGLDFPTLRQTNPRILLVSLTAFGQTGPYRDFRADELILEALSGQMYGTGSPDREPLCSGPAITQIMAGLHAFVAILMALRLRECDGQPRHIDVSSLEAGVECMELRAFPSWKSGKNPTRAELARSALVPWGAYRCRDGWAALCGAPFRRWGAFAHLLPGGAILQKLYAQGVENMERAPAGQPGSLGWLSRYLKTRIQEFIHQAVTRWAASRTRAEILETAREQSLAFGALHTLPEVLRLPQHAARNFWVDLDHPLAGKLPYARAPFPLRGLRSRRAPLLGEHQNQPASPGAPPPARPVNGGQPAGALPLQGVRILDLTLVEAAPHGARILADFGAEVIKVEYPQRLDIFRGTSLQDRHYDRQVLWGQINRNKRSLALDLRTEAGREAFLRLVQVSDVVLCNFRSGALQRLGLDFDSLRARRPGLILVSMSGYGDGGPDSSLPAYGSVLEAMSGVQNLTGYLGGKPERIREIDVLNGVAGAAAVLAALAHRDRWGEGQYVDLSQLETTTHSLMGEELLHLAAGLKPRPASGNRHPQHAPHGCYPCRGEDRWIAISIRGQSEWQAFAQLAGQPGWLSDPRYRDAGARKRHEDELDREIAAWTRQRDAREAMLALQHAAVPAGVVQNLEEVLQDPHLAARHWFHFPAQGEEEFFMGQPFQISGVSLPRPRRGPALGEANREWIGRLLGETPASLVEIDPSQLGTAFRLESRRR